MTYVIAIRYRDAVLMVADTGLTRQAADDDRSFTLFKQLQRQDGHVIDEAALKLIRVGDRALLGIVGDREFAYAAAENLNARWSPAATPREALATMGVSLGPWEKHVELLLACADGTRVSLSHWSSSHPQEVNDVTDGLGIGSGTPVLGELSQGAASALFNEVKTFTTDEALVALLARLQIESQHENLPAHRVSGAFIGAAVEPSGVSWQPDITWVLYKQHDIPLPDKEGAEGRLPIDLVGVLVREDAGILVTCTTNPPTMKLLAARARLPVDYEAFVARLFQAGAQAGSCLTCDYFVFLAAEGRTAVVHPLPDRIPETAFMTARIEGGRLCFNFNEALGRFVRELSVADERPGTASVRFVLAPRREPGGS